jgi:hypothetical protein
MPPHHPWGGRCAFHTRVLLWLCPQTFTFQRSSNALSVHVDGCNISVSSAVPRGVRIELRDFFSFERGASVSPSANAVGKENSQPPSSEITVTARRAS